MIKVGVVLSGCGVQDGSEIYEAVLTILALERAGVQVVPMAPDVEQATVINHYTGAETRMNTREVLSESARIVRGKIQAIGAVSEPDLDALILVGGYGAAKNLCTYANDGARGKVNEELRRLVEEMHKLGKPIGSMCIASVVVALALRDTGAQVILTVGSDEKVAADLEQMGAKHQNTRVDQICYDSAHNIVSTPAFMLAESALQCEVGITKLVDQIVGIARQTSERFGRGK